MKAQAFLDLVRDMRAEQIIYFARKSKYPLEAREHLIRAKQLEKQVDAVILHGRLELDEQLDFPRDVRPTEQPSLFQEMNNEAEKGTQGTNEYTG